MVWLRSFGKAVFLVIILGELIESSAYFLFPLPLFLIIAYTYQAIEWVKGSLGERSIRSFFRLRWNSCREGLNALIVLLFTSAIFLLVAVILFGATMSFFFLILHLLGAGDPQVSEELSRNAYDTGYDLSRRISPSSSALDNRDEDSLTALFLGIAWIGVTTLLYRYEEWAQQRKRSRKLKKLQRSANPPKTKIKPAPVDPVDLELDKIRADSGLLKMKKTTKKKI